MTAGPGGSGAGPGGSGSGGAGPGNPRSDGPAPAPETLDEGAAPSRAYSAARAALARWLRVPFDPPTVPPGRHSWARSFRPAQAYLRLLKLRYLLATGAVGVLGGFFLVLIVGTMVQDGHIVAGLALALAVLIPAFLWMAAGYWALQLQFDTTWYVMTDRAIRVRTGIWIIREYTVTFENAQNVKVRRGPLQRLLGIGDVTVETASVASADQHGNTTASTVAISGVDDPGGIRDRIIERMRASRSAGLGGDLDGGLGTPPARDARTGGSAAWAPAHLQALREIREAVGALR